MLIVMILLINISSNNDFDSHFLNCYFLKRTYMIDFFFQFNI